jgi:hypothetical protein
MPDSADNAVAAAEEIVGDAWVHVLAERRELSMVAIQAAAAGHNGARQALAAAVLEHDPTRIAAARIRLDQTFEAANRQTRVYEQAHSELVLALNLLARRANERMVNLCTAQGAGGTACADPAVTTPAARFLRLVMTSSHFSGRIARWLHRATTMSTGGGWSR